MLLPQTTLLKDWTINHAAYEAAGRKLAIVIGPGGNAGVIGSGAACALWQTQNLIPNALYLGSSVGAFSWMYTLNGHGYIGATTFGRFFCDKRFFNPLRLFTKHPLLGLNFVIHDVLEHHIPMPYHVARTSPFQLMAITTDSACKPHLHPLHGIEKSIAQHTLRATASMPLIGRTHDISNTAEWDGWVIEPHLLTALQAQGITDVVWILNRPLVETLSTLTSLLWKRIIRKLRKPNPLLSQRVAERLAAGNFLATPPEGLNLEVFHPHTDIPGNTRNSARLFHALGTSYRAMGTYLGHPNLAYPAEWAPYTHHMPQ